MPRKSLKSYYYDPEFGFKSPFKFYKFIKNIYPNITKKKVYDFVKSQETHQLTTNKKKSFNSTYAPSPKFSYQMDLMDIQKNKNINNNFRYILLVIDINSRFLMVKALKDKKTDTVFKAIKSIFKKYGLPNHLSFDKGAEFNNKSLIQYFNNNNIQTTISNPEDKYKNAVVERVILTIRKILNRYKIANKKQSFIKDLPKLISNYNKTYHQTIKTTPVKIWNYEDVNHQEYKFNTETLNKGDLVRIIKNKKTFQKTDDGETTTKQIYQIVKHDGLNYSIKNINNDRILKKKYRIKNLLKISNPDIIKKHHPLNDDEKMTIKKDKIKQKIKKYEGLDI